MKLRPDFMQRYLWFIATIMATAAVAWIYSLFAAVFSGIPEEYQWILALLSPILKDLAFKVHSKVGFEVCR